MRKRTCESAKVAKLLRVEQRSIFAARLGGQVEPTGSKLRFTGKSACIPKQSGRVGLAQCRQEPDSIPCLWLGGSSRANCEISSEEHTVRPLAYQHRRQVGGTSCVMVDTSARITLKAKAA